MIKKNWDNKLNKLLSMREFGRMLNCYSGSPESIVKLRMYFVEGRKAVDIGKSFQVSSTSVYYLVDKLMFSNRLDQVCSELSDKHSLSSAVVKSIALAVIARCKLSGKVSVKEPKR